MSDMSASQDQNLAGLTRNNLEKLRGLLECVRDWHQMRSSGQTDIAPVPVTSLEGYGLTKSDVVPLVGLLNKVVGEEVIYYSEPKYVRPSSERSDLRISFSSEHRLSEVLEAINKRLDGKRAAPIGAGAITKIVLVETGNPMDKVRVIINDDYQNPIEFKSHGKSWRMLKGIAEGNKIEAKGNRNLRTYFNANRLNPLYAHSGYAPVAILETRNGLLCGTKVLGGVITEATYKQKLKMLNAS